MEEENWRIKSEENRSRYTSPRFSKNRGVVVVNRRIQSTENAEKDTEKNTGRPVNSRRQRKASNHRQSLLQEELLLPSQVMDEEYIYFPSDPEAISNMKSETAGKWLVNGNSDMPRQDKAWVNLLPLCKEGILIGMKASTSIIADVQEFMAGEVILCYTQDADDVKDVKKAGDAIMLAIGDWRSWRNDKILYYKTNAASVGGLYVKEGFKAVTKYRLTPEGSFDVRDHHKRWNPVQMEE
ncbi:hypothetical protein JTE90_006229 [Oedothorax gibbosus]|uniref:Uncharacterized protein n=1 Tax=Oedothorax gibbosus TaxID=931172 RepID=A0AAV6VTF3_9ARAC|nr:hypothetical protein JTE90_006229 [Oedothorax gibbosus]